MEVDNDDTTEINSYFIKNVKKTDLSELSKKRKSTDDNFLLPSPKHACIISHTAVGSSETESGKGSNSIHGDHESASSSSSPNWAKETYDSMIKEDCSWISSPCDLNLIHPDAEYRNQLELVCSEYGIVEIEEIIGSNNDEKNPNNTYVLSSGRWSVGQDSQQDGRKPTIDQEFEQYFSKLML